MKNLILEMKHLGYTYTHNLRFSNPLETLVFKSWDEVYDFIERF